MLHNGRYTSSDGIVWSIDYNGRYNGISGSIFTLYNGEYRYSMEYRGSK